MPRTKKSTKQESDAATIADPTKKDPMVGAATAPEVKDDPKNKAGGKGGAQDTVNKNVPGGAAAAPSARRPLGTKEVIPFAWKVIGVSGEMVLTLFKSIEKEDSEAHLARLGKDGGYRNLRLVEADYKISQPKSVRAVFAANEKKAKTNAPTKKSKKKKARVTTATITIKLAKKTTTTTAAKKTKKTVRAATTKKKKVKKAAKKSTSRTVKAKKSAKQAVKKKTTTKSSRKKTKAKKK